MTPHPDFTPTINQPVDSEDEVEEVKAPPVLREDEQSRQTARHIRDEQWRFMERAEEHNPLWFCVWNKARKPEKPDEMRCGLMDGMETLAWADAHPDWFIIGEWDDARYARPVKLTEAGREALANRAKYDLEPAEWGMVEPGWCAIPLPAGQGESDG